MPDSSSAFIWYHADASMARELQTWVGSIGHVLGIPARLLIRSQPDKTTFMEIYELHCSAEVDVNGMVEFIETQAGKQVWFSKLKSPRRAEIFSTPPGG
ncbi:MAG: hypothetical protein COS82_00360 [Zetaproteobacteria bacterium CG06_land_8_20_14_3_00_59_53]|nr:MAG: hypothetical protein AUK36_05105 [Zetaproteobacteria bacterium CG2_30_59_37]PIO90444.1 MAG: hypothetical protein COX56_01415 [Zetaproteobacteria bacterium CG23_combo_of_CG06-09_8_20_14_all_59_86]PIQ65915.1 MAG: hypothetical protein COV97_00975 [Zetaproteobacteria bacterium CG11_big_fil_rev_8_21_14_0_20_59_439]PIU71395.1 MAG: hypothetical protein COS82_00360 [Zetaproteobacteria bacterium CG06_land_8_20_14_3_00_59_53]PIU97651.1 MAG: hypothetical protein COS62_01340 [Zetaproteobacteria bac